MEGTSDSFIDRVLDIAVLGWSSTCPLLCQRQGLGQTVEKTVAPQLHSSDKVVDVPCVPVVQILRCRCGGDSRLPQLQLLRVGVEQQVLGLWLRSCSSSTVMDVPVILRDSGSAPDSVHRGYGGHSSSQQRQVFDLPVAAVKGLFDAFASFFALLRLSRS